MKRTPHIYKRNADGTGRSSQSGYILIMTVLIVSILLGLSFSVYALSIREIVLASYLKESSVAFVAADQGAECALYWDRMYDTSGSYAAGGSALGGYNGKSMSIFASTTPTANAPASPTSPAIARCNGTQLSTSNWSATQFSAGPPIVRDTVFRLTFTDGICVPPYCPCADVTVRKDDISTTIISNGHNVACDSTSPRKVQRTIQITSNF